MQTVALHDARQLPLWRRPVTLLFLMAAAMPIAFSTWSALLNNFVIEVADFDGSDIGGAFGLWLSVARKHKRSRRLPRRTVRKGGAQAMRAWLLFGQKYSNPVCDAGSEEALRVDIHGQAKLRRPT